MDSGERKRDSSPLRLMQKREACVEESTDNENRGCSEGILTRQAPELRPISSVGGASGLVACLSVAMNGARDKA